jgi:hypothetical protein
MGVTYVITDSLGVPGVGAPGIGAPGVGGALGIGALGIGVPGVGASGIGAGPFGGALAIALISEVIYKIEFYHDIKWKQTRAPIDCRDQSPHSHRGRRRG